MQTLRLGDHEVRIDAGELVAYLTGRRELIHQKGSPGWRSSDAEMFPVIGPTAANDFRVETPRGEAPQDQHGLLRELAYALVDASATTAVYEKTYAAGTPVTNAKFPAKSSVEHLSWPYDFRFRKTFELRAEGLEVGFEIYGERGMPWMLGYHPAFRLTADPADVRIEADSRSVPLADVLAVGDRAYHLPDCTDVLLRDGDAGAVRLQTQGFGAFMLWAPVPTMICVEPITYYPYDGGARRLHEGFQSLREAAFAQVLISGG